MKPRFLRPIYVMLILVYSIQGYSQSSIPPYPLNITYNKTTNIIFPYAVKSVDRGSRDVLVQNAAGVENVLQVKAGKQNFQTTNLTVFTADGKLYSFLLSYSTEPSVLNLSFNKDSALVLTNTPVNAEGLDSSAALVLRQKRFLHISGSNEEMKIILKSIYIDQSLLWFTFRLVNHSLIGYQSEYIKFLIVDKKKGTRTAVQQSEIKPVFGLNPVFADGNSKNVFVFAFPAFTIPKKKKIIIQVGEKNGGRLLELHVSHKAVLKARLCS
jgi:conjugative transposon TraN protein